MHQFDHQNSETWPPDGMNYWLGDMNGHSYLAVLLHTYATKTHRNEMGIKIKTTKNITTTFLPQDNIRSLGGLGNLQINNDSYIEGNVTEEIVQLRKSFVFTIEFVYGFWGEDAFVLTLGGDLIFLDKKSWEHIIPVINDHPVDTIDSISSYHVS